MGTHGGAFDTVRLEWMGTQLAESNEPVLMFMHHAPIRVGLKWLDRIALQGEDEFWGVIAPFKLRIRHMFFGHMRRNGAGSWGGIPFTVAVGLIHQVMLDFQTDIVRHIEVEPYVSIIPVNDRDVVVHPHGSAMSELSKLCQIRQLRRIGFDHRITKSLSMFGRSAQPEWLVRLRIRLIAHAHYLQRTSDPALMPLSSEITSERAPSCFTKAIVGQNGSCGLSSAKAWTRTDADNRTRRRMPSSIWWVMRHQAE
ncbi:hypothetical protein [Bradyrhizobium sp. USDA 4529]